MANYVSENHHIISGLLAADLTFNAKRTIAQFTVYHNFGKDRSPLIVSFTMFAKNGNRIIEIPEALLTKGARVRVEYFERPATFVNENGETIKYTQRVVKKVEPQIEAQLDESTGELKTDNQDVEAPIE